MKIFMVSSFRKECGIGKFTYDLLSNLLRHPMIEKIYLVTHTNADISLYHPKLETYRLIKENTPSYVKEILKLFIKKRPDIVNVEWDHSLYSPTPLLGIYIFPFLFKARKKLFLSLHSLYRLSDVRRYSYFLFKKWYIGEVATKYYQLTKKFLVNIPKIGRVFTLYEHEEIKNKQNFVMIPQGINKIRSKTSKGWNDKITLTIFGFVRSTKDYSLAIRALSYLPSEYQLIIAGKVMDKNLAAEIKNLTKKLKLENRVTFIPRFLSEKEKEKIFQNTSILLLPYHIISNSGVLLDGIKYGKPVVATVLKEDIEKMGIGKFSSHTPKEFAEKILDCNREYQKILNNIRKVQPRFLWKNVIKEIVKAYARCLV